MSHCGTSLLYDHLDHCFVVFKHIQQSFLMRKFDVWGNIINNIKNVDHSLRSFFGPLLLSQFTTGCSVLWWFVSSSKLNFVLSREKRVWGALPWGQTTGLLVLSWFGFGFSWVHWELFACRATSPSACRATSEPKSFIQSCFKEIFGGGRSDA